MPEFEINDFLGIWNDKKYKGPKNAADSLINFDLRGQSGVLEQRLGYSQLYHNLAQGENFSPIVDGWIGIENLYITSAAVKQELTIQIIIGNLVSEYLNETQFNADVPAIFASHQWNGSSWDDKTSGGNAWNWLNEMVLTKLVAVDPTSAGNDHWVTVDIEEDGRAAADYFNGFYLVNYTEGGEARIVDCFTWNDGSNDLISFKLDRTVSWDPVYSAQLYIMKSYTPVTSLHRMSEAERKEISILKIRDELRISFGGVQDRIALTVKYQKSYWNIKELEVESFSSALIDTYCEVDGLIVTPYSLIYDRANIELSAAGSGTLPANTHYVKITAVMMGGDEILISEEANITTDSATAINYNCYISMAKINRQVKALKFYYSNDTLLKVFYYMFSENIQSEDSREKVYAVNSEGELKLLDTDLELHDPSITNAAAPDTTTDPLTTTDWDSIQGTLTAVADSGAGSINALNFAVTVPIQFNFAGIFYDPTGGMAGIQPNKVYELKCWLKRQVGTLFDTCYCVFRDENGLPGPGTVFSFDGTWTEYTLYVKSCDTTNPSGMQFMMIFYNSGGNDVPIGDAVRVDRVSLIAKAQHLISNNIVENELGSEMSAELGYTPTRNLVKSWDSGLVTAGRSFVVNGFIEKRYNNLIFFSAIGGAGNSMYDTLVAGLNYNVENFDGNDVRKIELLSNGEFLLLQSVASQRLDPDTGRLSTLGLNTGIVQPNAAVNFGELIVWPGAYDIQATPGIGIQDLSEDMIRSLYRALSDSNRERMHASREQLGNSYRLFSGDTTYKSEYVLVKKKGWIERRQAKYPVKYAMTREGKLIFMDINGYIYNESETDDAGTDISSVWKSMVFDTEMLGEGIRLDQRIILEEFALVFAAATNINITFTLDGVDHDTQAVPYGSAPRYRRQIKPGGVCNRFQITISNTGNGGPSACSIISVAVKYSLIRAKTHVPD